MPREKCWFGMKRLNGCLSCYVELLAKIGTRAGKDELTWAKEILETRPLLMAFAFNPDTMNNRRS